MINWIRPNKCVFTFFALIATGVSVLATAQMPDFLFVNGAVYPLYSNPLEELYDKNRRPDFKAYVDGESSGNWRGYIAYWQIRDQRLFLIGITSFLRGKRVFLSELFPGRAGDARILADWFSGELRVPDGKELQNVHMGYGSTYERDIVYTVRNGAVVRRRVIDNTKKPPPNEWKRGEEELQKLKEMEKRWKKP